MRVSIFWTGILSLIVSGVALFLFCNPPLDASSGPKVDILLESSTLQQDDDFLEDSLGNSIRIGITGFLPGNIDSATLLVTSPSGQTFIDTTFTFDTTLLYDTLWKTVTFYTPGIKNVAVTPYSSIMDLDPVHATLFIRDRELPDNPRPSLTVSGSRIVRPSETCSLSIAVSDTDTSQQVSLTVVNLPDSAVLQGDTLLIWPVPESFTGEDTIILIATDDGFPPAADTQRIIITVTENPSSPTLAISGDRTLTPSATCILLLDFKDADSGQTVTVTVDGNPDGSSIVDGTIFMWEIPQDFTGRDTVIFTATDNGTPPRSISDTVVIIVTETEINFAPAWTSDTLHAETSDRENLDMNLADSCSDDDGDTLTFSIAGENGPLTLDGTHVRFTPAEGTDTTLYFTLNADDGNNNVSSVVLAIRITALDEVAPSCAFVDPDGDSTSVNSPAVSVTISATDASGIASVVCSMHDSLFEVTQTDSRYTAIVTGLEKDVYNRIIFTVTDASGSGNSSTLILYIMYDPTMEDHTRPVVRRLHPATDSSTVGTANTAVSIVATDVSGIASVTCTAGEQTPEVTAADSVYSVNITGLPPNVCTRVVFVITDSSSNGNRDSVIYHIMYDSTLNDETPPQLSRNTPDHDTVISTGESIILSINAGDGNGIAEVTCFLGTQQFNVSGSGSVYSANVSGLTLNQYNRIVFTATDASANANRDSIEFHVLYDPTTEDHTGPTMLRHTPSADSGTVDTSAITITIVAFDASGIQSIACTMNDSPFTPAPQDNNRYAASISGLTENVWNRIVFTAVDNANSHNRDSVVYHIRYDRTMNDSTPPVITTENWPQSGSTTAIAQPELRFTVTDGNGIDSVWWTFNNGDGTVLQPASGNTYAFTVTLQHPQPNHIAVFTTDNSSRHNRSTAELDLIYNHPPVPQTQTVSTLRDSAVTVTLTATDPDGQDPITQWKIVSGPHHGSVTATVPEFTYIPAEHFEGIDSIGFRVWDEYDSCVGIGYVIVNVRSHNIAPHFTILPQNVTADSGSAVTIAAEINADAYPTPTIQWLRDGVEVHNGSLFYILNPIGYHDQETYTLRVDNAAGSDEVTFTITVRDRTYPVLTLLGSPENTVRLEQPWNDPGARAVDDRDGVLNVMTVGNVDISRTGRYEIDYSATDAAGNRSSARRVVYVEGWEHAAKFRSSEYATVYTNNNRFFVFSNDYSTYTANVFYFHDGICDTIGNFENDYVSVPAMALGSDGVTPYIAFYDQEMGYYTVRRWVSNRWETLIRQSVPVKNESRRYFLDLNISPDNDIPYIATAYGDVEDPYNSNCYIWRIHEDATGKYWERVTTEAPSAFYGSFRTDFPGKDKHVLSISHSGIPYICGHASQGQPICRRQLNSEWVPAGESDPISTIDYCVSNMQLLHAGNGDLFAGFAYCESSIDPKIFRLTGTTWAQLPSMTASGNGGGGFGMTISSGGILHAVHNEGDNFIVRSYNGIEWHNVIEVIGDVAFTDDNCTDVSVAAGTNDCYVTYLKNVPGTQYPEMYIRKGYHHQ